MTRTAKGTSGVAAGRGEKRPSPWLYLSGKYDGRTEARPGRASVVHYGAAVGPEVYAKRQ